MFKRFWWLFLVMVPIGTLSGFLVAAVATYVMPKKYESECVIEVRPSLSTLAESLPDGNWKLHAPGWESIKGDKVIEQVVTRLELANRWAVDSKSAAATLRGLITVQPVQGTDLVSIRARHTNKEESKEMVDALVAAYSQMRSEADNANRAAVVAKLKSVITTQETNAAKLREELQSYVGGLGKGGRDIAVVKADLDAAQTGLEQLKLKLVAEEAAAERGEESVLIHEAAVVPQIPVSPNVALNLGLGSALGLLLSPFLALPLMALLQRVVPAR